MMRSMITPAERHSLDPELVLIRKNNGDVVEQPYRVAVGLISRRLAEWADPDDIGGGIVPLEVAGTEGEPALQGDDTMEHVTVPEPSSEPQVLEPIDLDSLSKDGLITLAKQADLPTSGTKADLIARLSATPSDEGVGATTEDEPSDQVSDDGQS